MESVLEKEIVRDGKKLFLLVTNEPGEKTSRVYDEGQMNFFEEVENPCIHSWEKRDIQKYKTIFWCSKCLRTSYIDNL